MQKIHFYYDQYDHAWYADVVGHSKSQNLMVCGADRFLEKLSGDKMDVVITVSQNLWPSRYILKRIIHTPFGATYKVKALCKNSIVEGHVLWLCNVTHSVLGKHPKRINIIDVRAVERKDMREYKDDIDFTEDFKMLLWIEENPSKE